MDKRGDTAVQIQQRVQLHRGFILAKLRPWEQGKTQVDGGRVERIEGMVEFQPDRILGMKWSGDADQMLRKIGEDTPVVSFIGIGQSGARNLAAEAHVIEFAAHRSETRLNITQTLPVSELSESHRQILIPARQTSVMAVAAIASNALLELVMGKVGDQLREDGPASIHPPLFRRGRSRRIPTRLEPFSVQIVFGPPAL